MPWVWCKIIEKQSLYEYTHHIPEKFTSHLTRWTTPSVDTQLYSERSSSFCNMAVPMTRPNTVARNMQMHSHGDLRAIPSPLITSYSWKIYFAYHSAKLLHPSIQSHSESGFRFCNTAVPMTRPNMVTIHIMHRHSHGDRMIIPSPLMNGEWLKRANSRWTLCTY